MWLDALSRDCQSFGFSRGVALLIEPIAQVVLKLLAANAIQMPGIRDDMHGPIRPDRFQRPNIEIPHGIMVSDHYHHGHFDRLYFRLGHCESAQAARAGARRGASRWPVGQALPKSLQRAALAQPAP